MCQRVRRGLEYTESLWVDNIIANILPKVLATQSLYCGALEHLRLALEGFTSGVALESRTVATSPKQTDPED